jgi:hypothetical protein
MDRPIRTSASVYLKDTSRTHIATGMPFHQRYADPEIPLCQPGETARPPRGGCRPTLRASVLPQRPASVICLAWRKDSAGQQPIGPDRGDQVDQSPPPGFDALRIACVPRLSHHSAHTRYANVIFYPPRHRWGTFGPLGPVGSPPAGKRDDWGPYLPVFLPPSERVVKVAVETATPCVPGVA